MDRTVTNLGLVFGQCNMLSVVNDFVMETYKGMGGFFGIAGHPYGTGLSIGGFFRL